MKLTIFKKGLLLVAVPLVIQLAFIAEMSSLQKKNAEAQAWLLHSKEVLTHTQVLYMGLADSEATMKGFIITGNAAFARRFAMAIPETPRQIEALERLVADNPAQQERVRQIAEKAKSLEAWQQETLAIAHRNRDQAVARIQSGEGRRDLDALSSDIDTFLAEEGRLDRSRGEALSKSERGLSRLLAAGGIVSLLSTGLLVWLFSRSISGRLVKLSENAQRLVRKQELVPPIGGRDELAGLDQVFRDMAAQLRESEEKLRAQIQILELILESMGDGVIVADEKGKFTVFNSAAERMLGTGAADVPPEEWSSRYAVYLPDKATPFPTDHLPLVRALQGHAVDGEEMWIRRSESSNGVWISATARSIRGTDGIAHGGVVVIRDITKTKQVEDEIRKLNEVLEERVRERTAELEETNYDLREKNRENETFVYSVSHDLRSPLVNLQGFSQELASAAEELRELFSSGDVPADMGARGLSLLDDEIASSIRFIQTAVLRLANIIDALLRLSRAGRIEYQNQAVDVNAVVARIVESMKGTIAERGARLTIKNLPPAWGDPTAVEQIFANLIGNALNYLDPQRHGAIEIGCETNGRLSESEPLPGPTYYVKDNGLGIAEAHRSKLFQAFQRLHPDVAKGEGMGLALVRRMVERHRGKIWVQSKAGAGTTFFLSLSAAATQGSDKVGHISSRLTKTRDRERTHDGD